MFILSETSRSRCYINETFPSFARHTPFIAKTISKFRDRQYRRNTCMYLDTCISRSVAWMLNTSSQNHYHYFNSAFKNLLKKGPILISNHPFGSITQCMKSKLNVIVISNHYITSKLLRSKGGNSQCFTFLSKYRLWNLSKIDH